MNRPAKNDGRRSSLNDVGGGSDVGAMNPTEGMSGRGSEGVGRDPLVRISGAVPCSEVEAVSRKKNGS